VMVGDRRIGQLPADRFQRTQGSNLVRAHESAVANYVGGENRS
jgi:hypothetical protein